MKVIYSSNNSGGGWWLSDDDWRALERAGWHVKWFANEPDGLIRGNSDRWLGALATEASIEADSIKGAIALWAETVCMDPDEEGCSCCGQPHYFYEEYR